MAAPQKSFDLTWAQQAISEHLLKRNLDPGEFSAYQAQDEQIYAHSDELFCLFSPEDTFSAWDPLTFGLSSRLREGLEIPAGELDCMSVSRR